MEIGLRVVEERVLEGMIWGYFLNQERKYNNFLTNYIKENKISP